MGGRRLNLTDKDKDLIWQAYQEAPRSSNGRWLERGFTRELARHFHLSYSTMGLILVQLRRERGNF